MGNIVSLKTCQVWDAIVTFREEQVIGLRTYYIDLSSDYGHSKLDGHCWNCFWNNRTFIIIVSESAPFCFLFCHTASTWLTHNIPASYLWLYRLHLTLPPPQCYTVCVCQCCKVCQYYTVCISSAVQCVSVVPSAAVITVQCVITAVCVSAAWYTVCMIYSVSAVQCVSVLQCQRCTVCLSVLYSVSAMQCVFVSGGQCVSVLSGV